MTYTPPEGVTIGSFTARTLPASFSAPADAVVTYKIYGTSEGAGVETENLFDYTAQDPNNGYYSGRYLNSEGGTSLSNNYNVSEYIPITAGDYFIKYGSAYASNPCLALYDSSKTLLDVVAYSGKGNQFTFNATSGAAYIRISYRINYAENVYLKTGTTPFETFEPYGYKIPILLTDGTSTSNYNLFIGDSKLYVDEYLDFESQKVYKYVDGVLTPTDPPATLPTITATGETTISCTETLGDIELTGDWLAIMGSTQAESIDIGFTVDAEEYIAFVTVDDGPSIQVSDTITMPSSADSFSLEVVAWGREQYTDTVYNALS